MTPSTVTTAARATLREAARTATAATYAVRNRAGVLAVPPAPVQFVIEPQDWAIRRLGESVRDGVNASRPGTVATTTTPLRMFDRVVHFGSQYMWLAWRRHMARSNRFVTSFLHGKPEDGPEVARHIAAFLASIDGLDTIVVSNAIVEQRLQSWGVPAAKLVRIPLGVDTTLFAPPGPGGRAAARSRFNVPDGHLCIGSFQKDGVGWGDGMEPKPIKGPDVFVDTVARIHAQRPVYVLLTGPARGFVKAGLERLGVPYHHEYLDDYAGLVACYHALDLYLMSSREEGGPLAVMESMAAATPVVSTTVGMAPDLITDGVTGALAPIDPAALAAAALDLVATADLPALTRAARDAVQVADWRRVAQRHLDDVYAPLL